MSPKRLSPAQTLEFRQALLGWYDVHARDLPWRRTRDPYAIWVSEIMLQQTRVAAVLDHYARFLERFPSVLALALAPEDEVLSIWSGLGYYRRARMLQRAAQTVAAEHKGTMPSTSVELRRLPGIGEYTSAAIASIAFGEPVAVVDGNVERVLMRVSALAEKSGNALAAVISGLANALIAPERPGDFNQAMMELGATLCLPRNPLCLECPVQAQCATRGEHPTIARKKMQRRDVAFALIQKASHGPLVKVLLEQRPASESLMPGMWELPAFLAAPGKSFEMLMTVRHAITNTNYAAAIYQVPASSARLFEREGRAQLWVRADQLHELPLTGLARKVLKRSGLMPTSTPQKTSVDAPRRLSV